MKKAVAGAAILSFLLTSSAFADYVIKLKNGRTVETASYWEEDGQVKFQWQGGTASFPKKNIASILKVKEKISGSEGKEKAGSDRAVPGKKDPGKAAPENAAVAEKAEKKEETKEALRQEKESIPQAAGSQEITPKEIENYKKQKAYYSEQYEEAFQRYMEATSRKDVEGKKKAWEEFNRHGGKVISLEDELRKRNNGVVPPWWKE